MSNMSGRKWLLASSVLAGAALASVGTAAHAQSSQDDVTQVSEIVVTGSRIARQDYKSVSPIVTVDSEDIQATGSITIDTLMNDLPQFTPSISSTSNNPSNGGQANLDLRSLGSKRTLVLVNGRRLVPSNSDGSADVNLIPSALVRSVETISGGASAAYGSDAVAGVANFILNNNFSGVQVDAQYGQTDREDGVNQSYTMTIGGNFADDRGNAVISINRSTRENIFNAAREFAAVSGASGTSPMGSAVFDSANLPSAALVRSYFNDPTLALTGAFGFNNDGTVFSHAKALNFKSPGGIEYDGFYSPGSNYLFNTGALNYLQLPMERWNLYTSGRYTISENAEFYADAILNQYKASQELAATPAASSTGFRAPATNPFIPADLKAFLNSRPNPLSSFQLNKRFTDLGGRNATYDYNVYQLTGGVRGTLPNTEWTYDLYAQYGRVNNAETQTGNVSRSAVQTLLDAPDGGRSLCEGGFNPFGVQPISAACIDYIGRKSRTVTENEQIVVEGTLQGKAFDLPAGEARVAVGIQYRENTYDFESDPSLARVNPITPHLGANGQPDGGNIGGVEIAGFNAAPSVSGSVRSIDLFGEALLPLISNKPFIQQLDLTLGWRYADYSSIGGTTAYRADIDWEVVNGFRVRGGFNRSVRAPSIGELFSPSGVDFPAIGSVSASAPGGDPCDVRGFFRRGPDAAKVRDLCLAQGLSPAVIDTYEFSNSQVNGWSGGNVDLKEETADTYSIGLVYQSQSQSPWFSRFSASIDYYSIEIEDVISSISISDALNGCFNGTGENPDYSNSNGYCQLFRRDALNGSIVDAIENLDNLGVLKTSGVDLQVDWGLQLADIGAPDWGMLNFNAVVGWMGTREDSVVAGGVLTDRLGTISDDFGNTFPEWKSLFSANWANGPWSVTTRWRRVGEMTVYGSTDVLKATNYFDLSGSWAINDTLSLRGGINNVTDQEPRTWDPGVQANTDPSTYDILGRRYFIGLTAKF
ncbi:MULTISPECIES: TonB-dependent receptor domain-containing protein [unclassified Brevundimonas]|uniref:TonB-dependent receptor domain-containing protein n=1 Tax=unclassified Brevundimonas TaxID=2622653 RepID=UPI0025BF0611|nr:MULTISPECIES: TonB-dependent receptor [unclassified Brevundimonas]